MGCAVSGAARASLVEETGRRGRSAPARPSPGRIGGRGAGPHAVGRAGAACRRQMPTQIKEDCPLRAAKKVVCISYALGAARLRGTSAGERVSRSRLFTGKDSKSNALALAEHTTALFRSLAKRASVIHSRILAVSSLQTDAETARPAAQLESVETQRPFPSPIRGCHLSAAGPVTFAPFARRGL